MKLLLDRKQSHASVFSLVPLRIGSGVIFKLRAELELEDAERQLINHYNMKRAALATSDAVEDLKNAFRPAVFLGFITFALIWTLTGFIAGVGFGIFTILMMTIVYFVTEREQLLVNDLLDGGKTFRCDSIIDLVKKEAWLENNASLFRQVVESAKHWDERESVPIEALDKRDAKQYVVSKAA